jgi:phosphoglycerate dehydrogenase-like enzyme
MTVTDKPTVAILGEPSVEFGKARLPQYLNSDWTILYWSEADGDEQLRSVLNRVDAVIGGPFKPHHLAAPQLKLLQLPFAGYEWLKPQWLPPDCTVCNTFEHEIPIAEYVMLGILEWEIQLFRTNADFRTGSWRYCMPTQGPFHGEVYGKTLGLIGYGHIGNAIARRADAFGLRTIAVARTARPAPAPLGWLGSGPRDLDKLLQESDYVVVNCVLSQETRGLIDAGRLARMKNNALLINVARGRIVDEQALYQALRDHVIGGALLDTWYRYPFEPGNDETVPPSQFPFHELDNVYMTPHCSAWTRQLLDRRWLSVAANLDRLARGEPLRNIIHLH